jgi:type IV secretory pathway VirB3-like protein
MDTRRRVFLGVGLALVVAFVSITVVVVIIADGFVAAVPALIGGLLLNVSLIRLWLWLRPPDS